MGCVPSPPTMVARKQCLACCNMHEQADFSTFQWDRGRLAKCRWCVRGVQQPRSLHPSAQFGAAVKATVTSVDAPFAQGALRWIARAEYSGSGEPCAVTWYRGIRRSFQDDGLPRQTGHLVGGRSLFDVDMRISHCALKLVTQFNAANVIGERAIRVNMPEVLEVAAADGRQRNCWQTQAGGPTPTSDMAGMHVLVWPWLSGWCKLNSNTGWESPEQPRWAAALSHFSYLASGGECLLCNLKGTMDASGGCISDPAIHSRGRTYGPLDLGVDGIRNFFAHHKCNELCAQWPKPDAVEVLFPVSRDACVYISNGLPRAALQTPSRPRQSPAPEVAMLAACEGTQLQSLRPVYVVEVDSADS